MGEPALQRYRDKRRFDQTPEPAEGGTPHPQAPSFVIQKHWARRLHYDFRLEIGGTMKSWAVPKEPSTEPGVKRMAVRVEDHPIAYNTFEGTIPPGQYGAGRVVIWDHGTWTPVGDPARALQRGKLEFELHGERLHGRWVLVRMAPDAEAPEREHWLLIKSHEDTANAPAPAPAPQTSGARANRATPEAPRWRSLPATLAPQLATLASQPPDPPGDWLYEIKFDGYRMLTRVQGERIELWTRNGHDWTARLPALHAQLHALNLPEGWYDGEIILPGPDGRADFQALQGAFDSDRTAEVVYVLFDMPYGEGYDWRDVPLHQRRARLQALLPDPPRAEASRVRFSAELDAPPSDILAAACRMGLEGIIAKRRDAPYRSQRSADWLKLKCGQRQEFVVVGYTDPQGSRSGLGSLLLGVHTPEGALRYAGKVGTGFSQASLRQLHRQLEPLGVDRPAVEKSTDLPRGAHWVHPTLVAEVAFSEWTREGRVRHPVFHGLRSDKPARVIVQEQPMVAPVKPRSRSSKAAASSPAPASVDTGSADPALGRITHPERVIDAASGLTKRDLAAYYLQVAPLMLPHLRGRPTALVRAPEGVGGELFFQKHGDRLALPGIAMLDPALDPGHPPLLELRSAEGLVSAAQMNVIELHTWNALKDRIDRPDRMVFDLDPGEGVAWAQVHEGATLMHTLLTELGLPALLKTSGGKGLHLVVPLRREWGWDEVKGFSQAIVQHLARTVPSRFVAKSGPRNRVGRIFVDYLRNGFGATTVAAWSARARPGLGVSVPVAWDELDGLRSGAHWTVATVSERLAVGNQPWDDAGVKPASLKAAMGRLGYTPTGR